MILWRKVFRSIAQLASREGLERLLAAMESDAPELVQGRTTYPPPLTAMLDSPVEAVCAVGMLGLGDGLATVGEADAYFGRMCALVDERLGEVGAARHFLNWYDETPRDQMRVELIPEVKFALGLGSDPVGEVA